MTIQRRETRVSRDGRSFTRYLYLHVPTRRQLVHITSEVKAALEESEIQEGFALVSAMHITASVFVNDNERGLHNDIEDWLQNLAPFGPEYRHHNTGEDNGDAHLKSLLIGHEVIIPITEGELDLGTWQEVFYGEWDGKRTKRLIIKIMEI